MRNFATDCLVGIIIIVLAIWLGHLAIVSQSSNIVVSHPSVTAQPTLGLSFQGHIIVLGSLERMDENPDWSNEVAARPYLDPVTTTFVLPENHQPTAFYLTLVGQPGQDITVYGQIGNYHADTIVPLGQKSGEAVLAVRVSAEHKIKYDWTTK